MARGVRIDTLPVERSCAAYAKALHGSDFREICLDATILLGKWPYLERPKSAFGVEAARHATMWGGVRMGGRASETHDASNLVSPPSPFYGNIQFVAVCAQCGPPHLSQGCALTRWLGVSPASCLRSRFAVKGTGRRDR